jgi:hypothetical protein
MFCLEKAILLPWLGFSLFFYSLPHHAHVSFCRDIDFIFYSSESCLPPWTCFVSPSKNLIVIDIFGKIRTLVISKIEKLTLWLIFKFLRVESQGLVY